MAAIDQLDFLMHQPEVPTGQAPRAGFHGPIHHGQHQGCPYFRTEQHHQSSLPLPHPDPHFHLHPISHQLSHQLPHQQPSNATQNQTQPQNLQSPANGNRGPQGPQGAQQLPPLNPLQQPTLPYPHAHPHHPHHPHHPQHSHYDPVHSASGLWYPGPRSGTPWPEPTAHQHSTQTTHATYSRPSGPDLYFGGGGVGAAPGTIGVGGPGSVQPLLIPNPNQQMPPHHDHWMPFSLQAYHRPATYPRFPSAMPPNHPHNANRQNHLNINPQSGQANNSPPNSQPGQHTPLAAMSADRGGPLPSGRDMIFHPSDSMRAPSLNPNQHSSANSPSAISSPGDPGQVTLPPPLGRPPTLSAPDASSRPLHRDARDAASSTTRHVPQLPRPPLFAPTGPAQRTDSTSANRNSAPDLDQPAMSRSNPPPPSSIDLPISNPTRRLPQQPDYDSEEDPDSPMDDEEQALRYIEEFAVGNPHLRAMTEDHVRTTQLLRGQISNKRVASRKALAQLQSVDMDTLPENERTCVICYNEFGQPTPEGILEAPLRLPKCKHVFGDHCIKKWFEESDSCPYCRDKVHSEPAYPANFRQIQSAIRASYYRNRPPAIENGPPLTFVYNPLFPNPVAAIKLTRASPGTTLDEYARLMAQHDRENARLAQQDRDNARLMGHPDRGLNSTPPRSVQTGERRSPPSEASETRRRTRARRGSFRASQSSSTVANRVLSSYAQGMPAPPQQSPPHERSMPGNNQHHFYNSGHPVPQPAPPAEHPNPMASPVGSTTRTQTGPFNHMVYMPIDTLAMYSTAPSPFSQQLPPVGSLDATAFARNPVDGEPNTNNGDVWVG